MFVNKTLFGGKYIEQQDLELKKKKEEIENKVKSELKDQFMLKLALYKQ